MVGRIPGDANNAVALGLPGASSEEKGSHSRVRMAAVNFGEKSVHRQAILRLQAHGGGDSADTGRQEPACCQTCPFEQLILQG